MIKKPVKEIKQVIKQSLLIMPFKDSLKDGLKHLSNLFVSEGVRSAVKHVIETFNDLFF